ncbi:LysR family transcriptional regulator [Shimia abyssi]|uniref:LysR family glycine cleavage system transcriptional activator n=1 Tax=Shimia abyssi TaxID=1662395 RepID=A0A2P8FKL1_9RHOB|nr:LysR family transcriptional regulator [Shimia abyssi]PSL22246.1 LysR family glycine cleavage system transcriptional activator [Shimia abyssi]
MDWSNLPPLSAMRAFAAYADKGSVQAAGTALNVSHSAISQQIRGLEQHLGLALLDRTGRAAVLTREGQLLAEALLGGFATMVERVSALTEQENERPLHLTTTPTFAANWLMPRLSTFRAAHPEIDMMIDPTPNLADPSPGAIDLAIRYGDGNWPGLASELLLQTSIAVVAAPSLIGTRNAGLPSDLLQFPWLQELGTSESSIWLEQHGVIEGELAGIIHLPGNLMLDAARSGQGIAVTARAWIEEDLRSGRLRLLFEDDKHKGYHIVSHLSVVRLATRHFRSWLRKCVMPI